MLKNKEDRRKVQIASPSVCWTPYRNSVSGSTLPRAGSQSTGLLQNFRDFSIA